MSYDSAPKRFHCVLIIVTPLHLLLLSAFQCCNLAPVRLCPRDSGSGINFACLQQRIMLALLLTLLNSRIVHDDSGEVRLNRICVCVCLCVSCRLRAPHCSPNTQRAGVAGSLHWHHQTTIGGVFIFPGDTEGPGGSEYHTHTHTQTHTYTHTEHTAQSTISTPYCPINRDDR